MEHYAHEVSVDPQRATRLDEIEHFTQQWTAAHGAEDRAVVTIPVVVHLVYKTSAQNISDARIIAQIAQLNADYAHLNSDAGTVPSVFSGLAANTNIQFCLAQRDPSGNATTGIERVVTTVTSWSDNDAVKYASSGGANAWPAASYLNLWVCNLGSGLLGYAQFPGGTAATDGVVVLYSTVGSMTTPGTASPYQYGRSATHEVGHWLNLRHIWGDANCGNDQVSDTPTQQTSNFGCPSFPHVTCSNGPNGDMFMNYMDYVDDGCMTMFSAGQSARMNALFASGGARYGILSSTGCTSGGTTCAAPATPSAGSITTSGATISWGAVSGATSYNLQYKLTSASTWTTVNTTATSYALSGLTSGTAYNAQVQTVCSSGSSSYSSAVTFTTTSTSSCNAPTGLAAGSITTSGATLSWTAVSGATSYSLQYKLASASTWTTVSTTATSYALSGLASSTAYNAQVGSVCSSGSSAYSSAISFTTATPTGCSDVYESNNTSGNAVTIPVNTDIVALIGSNGDNDWYKFTNTSSTSKIKVTLTNLPGDYDVKLYRGTSTLLGTSQNGGTTSEQIISNTTTVSTYYIKVYGYNGAYSATSCYTLRASLSSTNWREAENAAVDVASSNSLLNLYPNPASDKLNVDFLAEHDTQLQVEVMDLTGRVVLTTTQAVPNGPSTFGLQLPDLRNGMYLLRITDGKQQLQQRFMLQR